MAYVKIIEREGGERSRIVVTNYALPGFKPDIGTDVFKQAPDGKNWELCVQSPEERKSAMAMSVDDYVKNGRHPMFGAVTTGELLKAQVEAKRFGYNNPQIEATLTLTNLDGGNISVPVIVDTATGMIERKQPVDSPAHEDDGSLTVQHLQLGKEQFEIESNIYQQSRVIDLPNLQQIAVRSFLSHERNANAMPNVITRDLTLKSES